MSNYCNVPLNYFPYHLCKAVVGCYNGANSWFSFLNKKKRGGEEELRCVVCLEVMWQSA